MNWIKSNPFVASLAGITLVICAALYLLGSKWATKYDSIKAEFDASYDSVASSEGIPLYPTKTNREGKRKSLGEYRESTESLRKLFDGYRPVELSEIAPQAFTDRLKKADREVSLAFESSGCKLPEDFLLGFEKYGNQLAQTGATGVLAYQLDGMEQALKALADANPSKLIKVYREDLPEESGRNYKPADTDVTRNFGFEVTFRGSEESAREFLSSLSATKENYYIVRCLKIDNEKNIPPNTGDAKFEKPAAERVEVKPDNPFADVFGELAPREEEPAGEVAPEEAEPEAEPDAPVIDSSRILAQVLGSEEVIVFVRIDLAMFLPSKELPKP